MVLPLLLLSCLHPPTLPTEACDGLDNDGDDLVDEGFDRDADQHSTCAHVTTPVDCNDLDPSVNPAAVEQCDGLDNDCDGTLPAAEQDLDADGSLACEGDCDDRDPAVGGNDDDGDGWTPCDGDCDDADATRTPVEEPFSDATERCDGRDNDCDGGLPWWEADNDGDGAPICAGDCDDEDAARTLGDLDGDGASGCDDDCDDTDPAIGPGRPEACNGLDDDCDGEVDEDDGAGAACR